MEQTIIQNDRDYQQLKKWMDPNRKILLVCDGSIGFFRINAFFETYKDKVVRFTDFQPNPDYNSVVEGVKTFRDEGCDALIAVGGGSAIDVAKCIRLYAGMPGNGAAGAFLQQKSGDTGIPFLAMPTTAGTGAEATRYAVIYYEGVKQSVTSVYAIPDTILMDSSVLKTLPLYQKKCTMLDALCHAIESFWSVNSTEESKQYSKKAIRQILDHMDGYLANEDTANAEMLMAANTAGKAINITQTTAGHAMSYKLTGLFGIPHGHAVALCNRVLFPWMTEHTEMCGDPRGAEYLKKTLIELAVAMGEDPPEAAAARFEEVFRRLDLEIPCATEEQFGILKQSVNPVRLKNHPISLDEETIDGLYHSILRTK